MWVPPPKRKRLLGNGVCKVRDKPHSKPQETVSNTDQYNPTATIHKNHVTTSTVDRYPVTSTMVGDTPVFGTYITQHTGLDISAADTSSVTQPAPQLVKTANQNFMQSSVNRSDHI